MNKHAEHFTKTATDLVRSMLGEAAKRVKDPDDWKTVNSSLLEVISILTMELKDYLMQSEMAIAGMNALSQTLRKALFVERSSKSQVIGIMMFIITAHFKCIDNVLEAGEKLDATVHFGRMVTEVENALQEGMSEYVGKEATDGDESVDSGNSDRPPICH